ncbi:MAG: putative serine/threonine-protein kinase ATG1t [Streblomastix strix]|uniref:Putative serine/threonine-protein kinase ATG1t n=1 Tax=Streblomastix strix TaxID=222440 RepID=A0A5J4VY11_9EUKA|nr:MAG: putative serine/threonine-protein kinase ATG1t [Streblomastix strix]
MDDLTCLKRAQCQLLRTLGKGAFGRVYLVDPGDGDEHAAKVMNMQDFNEREWEAAGRLAEKIGHCPYIIRYDGIFNAQKSVVILMEYANMPSLGSIIDANGRMPTEDEVKMMIWQLLQGVEAIHSADLMHRDLKPENILMHNPKDTDDVLLKISDFGLSRSLANSGLATTHCGTPLQMAPEVLIENGAFNNKADLWAVGIMIHPFKSDTLAQLTRRVVRPPRRISGISEDCWNLLTRLLAVQPKHRLSAQEALKHKFFDDIFYIVDNATGMIVGGGQGQSSSLDSYINTFNQNQSIQENQQKEKENIRNKDEEGGKQIQQQQSNSPTNKINQASLSLGTSLVLAASYATSGAYQMPGYI